MPILRPALILILLLSSALPAAAQLRPLPHRFASLGSLTKCGPATPDGNHFFVGAGDVVHVVSMETMEPVRSVRFRPHFFWSYEYHPVADKVILIGANQNLLWDWKTGETTELPMVEYTAEVMDDGSWVTRASDRITYIDPLTGEESRPPLLKGSYEQLDIDRAGQYAIGRTLSTSTSFDVLDQEDGSLLNTIAMDDPAATQSSVNISIDGNLAAMVHWETGPQASVRFKFWSLPNGAPLEGITLEQAESLRSSEYPYPFLWTKAGVILMKDSEQQQSAVLIRPGQSTTVTEFEIFDAHQFFVSTSSPDDNPVFCTFGRFYPDAGVKTEALILNSETGALLHRLGSHNAVRLLRLANDDTVFVGDELHRLTTWPSPLARQQEIVLGLADSQFDPEFEIDVDGTLAVSNDWWNPGHWLWDIASGSLVKSLPVFGPLSPDGALVAGFGEEQFEVFNVATMQLVDSYPVGGIFTGRSNNELLLFGHESLQVGPVEGAPIVDVPVSLPTGATVSIHYWLTVSRNSEYFCARDVMTSHLAVGAIATGEHHWVEIPNNVILREIAVSNDGRYLVANRSDLSIWDAATGEQIHEIEGTSGTTVSFSHDGDWLYTGGSSVMVWPFSLDACSIACEGETVDTDGDGLSDCVEEKYGIDPNVADSDGDGFDDGVEAAGCGDPRLASVVPTAPCVEPEGEGAVDGAEDGEEEGLVDGSEDGEGEGAVDGGEDGEGEGAAEGEEGELEGMPDGEPTEGEGENVEGEGLADGEGELIEGEGLSDGEGELTEGDGEVVEGEGELVEGEDPAALAAGMQALFSTLDANHDGLLTLEELQAHLGESTANDIALLDTGGDGTLQLSELWAASGERTAHSSDTNGDSSVSLSELLRVVQFYNAQQYGCAQNPGATEDGYTPGAAGNQCVRHSADYLPTGGDGIISLSELLRLIQVMNAAGYTLCGGQTEDGVCL